MNLLIERRKIMIDDIIQAIANLPAKGYRINKNGKYETFVSNRSASINLGTYSTKKEAILAIIDYRLDRFISSID